MSERYAPCLRCGTPLIDGGQFELRQGSIIITWAPVAVYVCPACRKVELYWADVDLPEGESGELGAVDTEAESITCLQCGSIVPAGENRCRDCGWTYQR